jgi:hypothetical protein
MSASETPFVAAADVMNPARRLCAAKLPSMAAASVKRFTSRATSIGAIRFSVSFLPPLNVRKTGPSTIAAASSHVRTCVAAPVSVRPGPS